jgi:hypothetical protein
MRRPLFTPALVAGALLLAFSACNQDSTSAPSGSDAAGSGLSRYVSGSVKGSLVAADPTVIATFTNTVSGQTVKVFNGGYGSAIAADPLHANIFYLLTDRGPNFDFNGGIAFPVPDFDPQIGVFHRSGGTLVRDAVIGLKDQGCNPLTGLPIPAGTTGSTGQIAYRVDGTVLDPDPNGILRSRTSTRWCS